MTYKNGIKEYALTGVMFGVPMGILFGLMHLSLLLGIITLTESYSKPCAL
mgnify:CR=1 FL=1